ncbi:MAG: hypothetical protein IKI76_07255 [Selenomonadaceae bacterium]|nr:hypothetical protein [Selenomonadaceae bacterium]
MKKFLAVSVLAVMALSVGCGNKVEEVKQEAVSEVQEAASDVKDAAAKVEQKAAQVADTAPTSNVDSKFSLGGISPGMTFDEAKKILGEPTSQHDDDEFTFANGLMIDVEGNVVEEVKTRQSGVKTAGGVEVGMTEQNMIDAYGAGLAENDDGVIEHKYYSGDRRIKLTFDVSNGSIVEIKCSLRD